MFALLIAFFAFCCVGAEINYGHYNKNNAYVTSNPMGLNILWKGIMTIITYIYVKRLNCYERESMKLVDANSPELGFIHK